MTNRFYWTRFWSVCLISLIISLLIFCTSASASDPYYYPSQPSGAILQTAKGVLVDYGLGRSRGTIVIQKPNGARVLFWMASRPLMVDGASVYCQFWWLSTCTDWPSSLIVGTTTVTVTYWTQVINGQPVAFSNSISTK